MSQSSEIFRPIVDASTIGSRRAARPTARQWLTHLALLLLTGLTTTLSGIIWVAALDTNGEGAAAGTGGLATTILMIPWYYLSWVGRVVWQALTQPAMLVMGLKFSIPLLAILAAHESGHYLLCRYYGVDATLPFFIPQPPGLFPGTFGAFIRMKSAVPSRRALFDIGLAGPLAGFILIVPFAFIGVLTLHHAPLLAGEGGGGEGALIFNDPLLFRLIARAFKIDLDNSVANSFYLAAWVGALVTALNLMPVGQLDGGHGTFAAFGRDAHRWIGRVAFVAMAVLAVLGWVWHGSPAGFVYTVLLAVMLRVRHPQPEQMEPLGLARTIVGIVTLIVFAVCFLPFPISVG
jgi:membrane-associated protease RseP (regulator of RpoE activity)